MTKKLLLAACVAAMALTGCKKDPQPEPTPGPTPEPQTVSRLASIVHKNVMPNGMETRMVSNFSWENGNLLQEQDSVITPMLTVVTTQKYVYENGNLVRVEESTGKWTHYFTYENGLLKTFVDFYENDTLFCGEITAYNADGKVEEVIYDLESTKNKYHLTWVDGDATQLTKYVIFPAEQADTLTSTIAYDGKPSVFTGFPLAFMLGGSDAYFLVERHAAHNILEEGYIYNYDEKSRLVSKVKENDSTFYQYIEQTVE